MHFSFAVIAMRDVEFFASVAKHLDAMGHSASFVSFYAPGNEYLRTRGFQVFDTREEAANVELPTDLWESMARAEQEYGFRFRELTLHERLTFDRFDDEMTARKLLRYLAALERFAQKSRSDVIVQELGGFIAQMALFYAARRADVQHCFLEPTLFPGRLFFIRNDLSHELIEAADSSESGKAARLHLDMYRTKKPVAMALKDRHHFRDATLAKLINGRNIRSLTRKLFFKYIVREPEEFDAIGNHISRFMRMWWNRKRLNRLYSSATAIEPQHGPYVYFPFHVPIDFALTVRAREYLDQISLIRYVAGSLPPGVRLLVKEHPAAIGAYSPRELREPLKLANLYLLHPTINSFDIVANSEAVVTINSKVGAEALMQGKPVVVLGSCFYRGRGLTVDVGSLPELGDELHQGLSTKGLQKPNEVGIRSMLRDVHASSRPGELYVGTIDNVQRFSTSLLGTFSTPQSDPEHTSSSPVACTARFD